MMQLKKSRQVASLLISSGLLILAEKLTAQVIPDTAPGRSLGTELVETLPGIQVVENGTRPQGGANLFHSFAIFDIPLGQSVYFNNPVGVQNILARVTGGRTSQIQGTLGVFGGSANLFLLNPNGIVFERSAALDLGGSFIATTANAIQLGASGRFDAALPEQSNLLSVDPSALLFSNASPQAEIINRSIAQSTASGLILNGDPLRGILGLQVQNQQNLILVEGNVTLDGGLMLAPGGRIELGGLATSGTVELKELDRFGSLKAYYDLKLQSKMDLQSALDQTTGAM